MTPDAATALAAVHATLGLLTAGHALLAVRDPRAAWGWIAACLLAPIAGPLLYLLFGSNRIAMRAPAVHELRDAEVPAALAETLPGVIAEELRELVRIGAAMTGRPLVGGNRVTPLHDGRETYPAMLAAIAGAAERVWLSSYIFSGRGVGATFVAALAAAQARGVDVRVLIDGVGDLYEFPRASARLRAAGVPVRRFQIARRLRLPHLNLRNHRKLLIIDRDLAFTGGMNIRDHSGFGARGAPLRDLHFRLDGPVAAQLADTFLADWQHGAPTAASPPAAASPAAGAGTATGRSHCRVITDGPDEGLERVELVLLAALANAHQRVCLMTPYFIPMPELARGLEAAALRGVSVELIVPARSNLRWVDWASRRWQRDLIARGVKVWLSPPPFAHSKLVIVDDYYTLLGSTNLDPRSLRLNFELIVETYCADLAATLQAHFDAERDRARPQRLDALDTAATPRKLRDALCWLFSSYL